MYLRGFDRRGSAASMHNASASGFSMSGCWSDQVDFAVAVLFDADDTYGHLFTSRYLPDFNLAGVKLDFDLALTGCQNPISLKYASVPWGSLSYIKRTVSAGVVTETPGTVPLNITATSGGSAATASFTIAGTPTTYDRLYLVYLGNTVFDTNVGGAYSITTGDTLAMVAAKVAALINSATSSTCPLQAGSSGATVTVNYTSIGQDGNGVELLSMYKTAGTTQIYPAGSASTASGQAVQMTGGVDPTSIHVHLDFSALGLASVRQLWLTLAPALNYASGVSGASLVPYVGCEWSAVFSNWTVADPGGVTPLKVAGPGSVTVTSSDAWAKRAGSGWSQVPGWYVGGFAWQSGYFGDTVTVTYSCQSTHDLYLGTALSTAGGSFIASVDGGAAVHVSTYSLQSSASPTSGRRLIASGIAAGSHTVFFTVAIGTCLFDFLQAVVSSDPVAPSVNYPAVSCACDFDTGQTYQIAPARLLWILNQAGLSGDIDFYSGVFFALKRVRNGGSFRQATITLSGSIGGTDVVWVTVGGSSNAVSGIYVSGDTEMQGNRTGGCALGGTVFGVAAFPADTLATFAQRVANAINGLFVGICAAPTSTPGQLTVTVLSPINGFSLDVSTAAGSSVVLAVTGDIGVGGVGGNEGTWAVDPTQAVPLNRAFVDYVTDLAGLVKAAGHTMTVAFSQELLAPPDSNDAAPASVTFGFFNYLGTGYAHTITIGTRTYTHVQLSTDGSGDIATALAGLINAGAGDPNAVASVSANNVALAPRGTGDIACTASDGNGPGTLKSGAWSQQFSNGTPVLTSTGFGSWGAGVVESVSGSGPQAIQQTGHGYITGNTVHVAQGSNGAVWSVTVTDANHYQLTSLVSGTAFTVAAGATTLIDLQTTQCNFNPATVTAYLKACYSQAAGILKAAGLTPWLQFGEVGWWFFGRVNGLAIGYASYTAPISVGTVAPHGLSTGQGVIDAGVQGNTAANGDFTATVTDSTHFTLGGSSGNGNYVAGTGTMSGGGMAYYDAYTASAAVTALGRALTNF